MSLSNIGHNVSWESGALSGRVDGFPVEGNYQNIEKPSKCVLSIMENSEPASALQSGASDKRTVFIEQFYVG